MREISDHAARSFARLMWAETDAAAIEMGAATPDVIVPWDKVPAQVQVIWENVARRLLNRLVWDAISGMIVVMDEKSGAILAVAPTPNKKG